VAVLLGADFVLGLVRFCSEFRILNAEFRSDGWLEKLKANGRGKSLNGKLAGANIVGGALYLARNSHLTLFADWKPAMSVTFTRM